MSLYFEQSPIYIDEFGNPQLLPESEEEPPPKKIRHALKWPYTIYKILLEDFILHRNIEN